MKKSLFHLLIFLFLLILTLSCNRKVQSQATDESRKTPETILLILKEHNHLSIDQRIELYFQKKNYNSNLQNEADLNMYGYSLLWDNKVKEAIEIFKLVVAEFPESSNAYDSLGEAYLADGDIDRSLKNYEKSLDLDPENFNAEDQIERMKYPDRKPKSPLEKFADVFTPGEYIQDLDQLGKRLSEVHPNVFKFISESDFWRLIESKKSLITSQTTYAEFAWHCSEIIASLNCSHTTMDRFFHKNQILPDSLQFPLVTRWVKGRLYVISPFNSNGDQISIKDEILEINGIPVQSIIKEIYNRIPSQGYIETTKAHEFNKWSSGMIAYALGFPKQYTVKIHGREEPIVLEEAKHSKGPLRDNSIDYCGDLLCLDFLGDGSDAVLTISSFNYYRWNNFNVFEDFIDKSFAEIREKGVENLVIDLRLNGGGSQSASILLLRYLMEEPFTYYSTAEFEGKKEKVEGEEITYPFSNRYEGQVYFIIDGLGNSTTGHFMSIAKVFNLGIIVGEELGSNQFCSAGQTPARLSNTKLNYYIANNSNESLATSLPDEKGIMPDHFVSQSIDEYLNGEDAVKNYTLQLFDRKFSGTYLLNTPSSWGKEIIRFPIGFAPLMAFDEGFEDARFPKEWSNKASTEFWSYAFAWSINSDQVKNDRELQENLRAYFDGLMNVVNKDDELEVPKTEVEFHSNDLSDSTGIVRLYDAFHTKTIISLNFTLEKRWCYKTSRFMALFRFSPQKYDNEIWTRLNQVTLRDDICEM